MDYLYIHARLAVLVSVRYGHVNRLIWEPLDGTYHIYDDTVMPLHAQFSVKKKLVWNNAVMHALNLDVYSDSGLESNWWRALIGAHTQLRHKPYCSLATAINSVEELNLNILYLPHVLLLQGVVSLTQISANHFDSWPRPMALL